MSIGNSIHISFAGRGCRKAFSVFLTLALVCGALLPCSPSMAAEADHALAAVHDGMDHAKEPHLCVSGDQCDALVADHRSADAEDTLTSLPFPIASGPGGIHLPATLPETVVHTEYIPPPSGRLTYLHTQRLRI